jgi:O-antigen/teichoic acid export membrane protein
VAESLEAAEGVPAGSETGSPRFSFPASELRGRTVRGVAINAVALALIDGLVLAQGLITSRLLGPGAIGLYGIVTITVTSLLLLKRVGIDEAFVQQDEVEQESEFQRAFTLELIVSVAFALLICAAAPILAAVYSNGRLLPLTLATSYLPLAFALQAPAWIFFRRMDYARQRTLQALVPAVTFVVTVPLVATGFGVWSLVIGPMVGNAAGAAAAIAVTPYRLRLRFDLAVARRYLAFSGPIFVALLALLVVNQGQVLAFDLKQGLAGAGFLTLAFTLTRYVDRADQVIASTLYPVVCSLKGRTRALTELFEKSNRATLMWVMPFAGGVVLFAPDLVAFVIGHQWAPAVLLLQGLAVATALQQVGYNWFSFYRAHGRTRETAIEAVVGAGGFLLLAVPGLIAWGTWGFVAGRVAGVLVALAVRVGYVHDMLPRVRLGRLVVRSLVPVAAAATTVLAVRLAAWGGPRSALHAALEAVLFVAVFAGVALRVERELVAEALGAWRARQGNPATTMS